MSLRDWTKQSGAFKISELSADDSVLKHLTIGTKYLECVTDGSITIPTTQAVGTWEFDINMASVTLFSDLYILNNPIIESAVGYGFGAGYRNRIMRCDGSATIPFLFRTASGVNLANTWYSIKLTRTTNGIFTMYIRGGAYGRNWVLVSETGDIGSNPVTDTNYFKASLVLLKLRAGDKIANIKIYDGVRQ